MINLKAKLNYAHPSSDCNRCSSCSLSSTFKGQSLWITVFTLICAVLSSHVMAGAWVPKSGSGYSKFSYTFFNADQTFGDVEDFSEFTGQNYSYYGEYGLKDENWAVFGSVLVQDLEQIDGSNQETSSAGFGDLEIGLRYQWTLDSAWVFSTAGILKLPHLYDEDDELPRGNGQTDFEYRFLLGRGLGRLGYFGLEAGYRFRFQEPSDEFRYLVEYGFNLSRNLYFRTKLDVIKSINNAEAAEGGTGNNLTLAPEFDLGKNEITLGWNFKNGSSRTPGIEFTFTNDVFGDNTLKGEAYQIGYTISY